jgi:hypothetical protein
MTTIMPAATPTILPVLASPTARYLAAKDLIEMTIINISGSQNTRSANIVDVLLDLRSHLDAVYIETTKTVPTT